MHSPSRCSAPPPIPSEGTQVVLLDPLCHIQFVAVQRDLLDRAALPLVPDHGESRECLDKEGSLALDIEGQGVGVAR